jgi:hypothetical protein
MLIAHRLSITVNHLSELCLEDYQYEEISKILIILIPMLKREDIAPKFYEKLSSLESLLIKEAESSNVPS